jgi:Methyl-CpG binding domain
MQKTRTKMQQRQQKRMQSTIQKRHDPIRLVQSTESSSRPLEAISRGRTNKTVSSDRNAPQHKTSSRVVVDDAGRVAPPIGARYQRPSFVSEGPPTEVFKDGRLWPKGWIREVCERLSGKTKGDHDRYWFPPNRGIRLRSMIEVTRFLAILEQCNGDYDTTIHIFKKGA